MTRERNKLPVQSSDAELDDFLNQAASLPQTTTQSPAGDAKGRLIFAMDATASREPTWDMACGIQAEMFAETAAIGRLAVQLAYFRGFQEFEASPFTTEAGTLLGEMTAVRCRSGRTQIQRLLRHAIDETNRRPVNALVFVGDAFEESLDLVADAAGQLGLLGVRAFMFHEGGDPLAGRAFKTVARLTGGSYCRFHAGSARTLRDLLTAVAVYAVGGYPALEDHNRATGRDLLRLPGVRR